MDPHAFASDINNLNAILRSALDPYYGLLDNFLTSMTFQLWPYVVGTHHDRVCEQASHLTQCIKRFYTMLEDMELRLLNPAGLQITPPAQTAFMYLEFTAMPL